MQAWQPELSPQNSCKMFRHGGVCFSPSTGDVGTDTSPGQGLLSFSLAYLVSSRLVRVSVMKTVKVVACKDYSPLMSFWPTSCIHTHGPGCTHVDPCMCTYAHTQHTSLLCSLMSTPLILFDKFFPTSAQERARKQQSPIQASHLRFLPCSICRLLKTEIFFWASGKSVWGREKTPRRAGWPPSSGRWRLKKRKQQYQWGKGEHQAALEETEGPGGKAPTVYPLRAKPAGAGADSESQSCFLSSPRWVICLPLGSLHQQCTQLKFTALEGSWLSKSCCMAFKRAPQLASQH